MLTFRTLIIGFLTLPVALFALPTRADNTPAPQDQTQLNQTQQDKTKQGQAPQDQAKQNQTQPGKTKQGQTASDQGSQDQAQDDQSDQLPEDQTTPTKDPLEKFNRAMYGFNDMLDRALLKPIATVYDKIMPKPLHTGITNFFSNLDQVPTIANDLLQGNFYQATNDAWRFGINSTIGLAGFIDVGSRIGLEENHEDFGLTMAQWGYTDSSYLVLPFFGPNTIRDGIGIPVNYYGLSVYPHIHPERTRDSLYALSVIDKRANLLRFENVLNQAALDKYVFIRDAYLQRRNYLIERNHQLGDPYLEQNNSNLGATQGNNNPTINENSGSGAAYD